MKHKRVMTEIPVELETFLFNRHERYESRCCRENFKLHRQECRLKTPLRWPHSLIQSKTTKCNHTLDDERGSSFDSKKNDDEI